MWDECLELGGRERVAGDDRKGVKRGRGGGIN